MKTQNPVLKAFERMFRRFSHRFLIKLPRQDLTRRLTKYLLEAQGFGNPQTMFDSGEQHFLMEVCQNVELVIDVGASIGDYSLWALTSDSACRVHAVEPLSICQTRLAQIQARFPARFTFEQSAVGAESGSAEILYHRHSPSSATLDPNSLEFDGTEVTTERVQVTTIDNIVESNGGVNQKSLIKVDVEGFEPQALLGASKMIAGQKAIFQVEISQLSVVTGSNLYSLYRDFFDGWKVFRLLRGEEGMIQVDPRSQWANLPLFSNLVFLPPSEAENSSFGTKGLT